MKDDFVHLGAGALSQTGPHDEFLELCAISASGELTEKEQKRLQEHLAICPSCREVLRQYESIVDETLPALAATEDLASLNPGSGWSQKEAEKRFFDRLEHEGAGNTAAGEHRDGAEGSGFRTHAIPPASESAWNHVWMLYAAGILLFAALGLFTYRVGIHRGSNASKTNLPPAAQSASRPSAQSQTALEEQLSDAGHERATARLEIAQRDRTIADLKRQLARQSDEINQLRTVQGQLQTQLQNRNENQAEVVKQQADLTQRLQSAENSSHALQARFDSLTQESAQDAARARASDVKVSELTKLLQDREAEIEQQEQMLAHDRDIRELMGARDLYIAEVYDVGDRGQTKKPYGRVFYTRGKSLIFYAYDLDQESQLKRASTFQAWGRRGPDRRQAVNLGIFYEDNATRKRWVMKCDDPRTLGQIDAVFVTIEQNGPSHKPSDKTLLFAYLKVNPNHP